MTRPTPVLLEFDPSLRERHEKKPIRDNLSVAVRTGRNLWVASDETTTLERLTEVEPGRFARHERVALHDLLDLPGAADEEVDVEGLGFDDGYLWLVGSHGLKRKKPKKSRELAENLERLATVSRDPNRYLLARIPCVPEGDAGDHVLRREATAMVAASPEGEGQDEERGPAQPRRLVAARLAGDAKGNELMDALAKDEHLAPFLPIPGKDNGFDVEGLAVNGDRLFVGLRGPVLRGWAVILSLELAEDADDPSLLRLQERVVARDADGKKVHRCYAKHFVNLGGMGIRELRTSGRDLLILAGPTMQLDGTIAVFRWTDGALAECDSLVPKDGVTRLFDVPHGTGENAEHDRAEGMTLWPAVDGGAECELLVVYDSPAASRCRGEAGVTADLFALEPAEPRKKPGLARRVRGAIRL